MKNTFFIAFTLIFFSCNQPQTVKIDKLQSRIDYLENQLADTYKPGFGEIMSSIQAHHAKLWFAGINQNWKLADFEVHELIEGMDNIIKYQSERKESQLIEMINPALDSVKMAIKSENSDAFKSSYSLLTNNCNKCHADTEFEFNIVKTPTSQQFSNQDF